MEKKKNKKLTTIQSYPEDAEYINSICKKGEHNRDKLKEILEEYKSVKKNI